MVLTRLILGMFACNTVSLYTIKLMMIIQGIIELGYNIRSAWFLDIRISTIFSFTLGREKFSQPNVKEKIAVWLCNSRD